MARRNWVPGGGEDEVYDDFEDLETGKRARAPSRVTCAEARLVPFARAVTRATAVVCLLHIGEVHKVASKTSKTSEAAGGQDDEEEDEAGEMMDGDTEESKRTELLKKKQALKESFNAEYGLCSVHFLATRSRPKPVGHCCVNGVPMCRTYLRCRPLEPKGCNATQVR